MRKRLRGKTTPDETGDQAKEKPVLFQARFRNDECKYARIFGKSFDVQEIEGVKCKAGAPLPALPLSPLSSVTCGSLTT